MPQINLNRHDNILDLNLHDFIYSSPTICFFVIISDKYIYHFDTIVGDIYNMSTKILGISI